MQSVSASINADALVQPKITVTFNTCFGMSFHAVTPRRDRLRHVGMLAFFFVIPVVVIRGRSLRLLALYDDRLLPLFERNPDARDSIIVWILQIDVVS